MKIILSLAFISVLVLAVCSAICSTRAEKSELSWPKELESLPGLTLKQTSDLFIAMAWQESRHKPDAYNKSENAAGIVQIRPGVVKDVNNLILDNPIFALQDRYRISASQHIYFHYLSYWGKNAHNRHNQSYSQELYARSWNGGPSGYKKSSTDEYWDFVQRWMREKPWNK